MKKLLFACFAVLLMAACGPKNHYSIEGVVADPEAEGATIYIFGNGHTPLDSVVITNGAFAFEGTVEEAFCGRIAGRNDQHTWGCQTFVVIEPGKIHVDIDNDIASGTRLNDAYNAVVEKHGLKAIMEKGYKMMEGMETADSLSQRVMREEFNKYRDEVYQPCYVAVMHDLIDGQSDNVLGLYAAKTLAQYGLITVADLEQKMADPNSLFAKDSIMQVVLANLRNLDATSAGHHFVDFECIQPTGEMGHLSDVIAGKLALVDFWASWCSPCREEISTNLIRLSKQYAKQGLLVVGVDVWDQIDKHAAAVEQLGIPYPQVIDTTRNATNLYGIQGIPEIMLIAPDGTIIARDLRGGDIEDAIVNALK